MSGKPLFSTLASLAVIACLASPAKAEVYYDVVVTNPPPSPRYEVVPVSRSGHVWAPGYWNWKHSRHVWTPGHWVEARPGYVWVNERWEHDGNEWRLARGYWSDERTLGDREWRRYGERDWDNRDWDRQGAHERYRTPNDPSHHVVKVRHNG